MLPQLLTYGREKGSINISVGMWHVIPKPLVTRRDVSLLGNKDDRDTAPCQRIMLTIALLLFPHIALFVFVVWHCASRFFFSSHTSLPQTHTSHVEIPVPTLPLKNIFLATSCGAFVHK